MRLIYSMWHDTQASSRPYPKTNVNWQVSDVKWNRIAMLNHKLCFPSREGNRLLLTVLAVTLFQRYWMYWYQTIDATWRISFVIWTFTTFSKFFHLLKPLSNIWPMFMYFTWTWERNNQQLTYAMLELTVFPKPDECFNHLTIVL